MTTGSTRFIKPNFLIIGAAKCGTTSLYHYLRSHPEVFMPERKEPSFFVPEAGGFDSWEQYLNLFKKAEGYKRIGEASVSYLMDQSAPQKIKDKLGANIKIIILLRNPVDMAYSNWGHQTRAGTETLSFLDALLDENRRLTDPLFKQSCRTWFYNVTYITRAKYYEQVRRYFDIFDRNNIAIYIFEEFFRPSLPLYPELCKFLGISDKHCPEEKVHNMAGSVHSIIIRRILNEKMAWKEPLKLIIPSKLRKLMMDWLAKYNYKEQALSDLSGETINIIRNNVKDDIYNLAILINRPDLPEIWNFEQ